VLTAIDELVHPDDASVHVSNRSRDRATVVGRRGESPAEALALGALNACPGVRRSSLYVTPTWAARLPRIVRSIGSLTGPSSAFH
jgi:hypothetical protein